MPRCNQSTQSPRWTGSLGTRQRTLGGSLDPGSSVHCRSQFNTIQLIYSLHIKNNSFSRYAITYKQLLKILFTWQITYKLSLIWNGKVTEYFIPENLIKMMTSSFHFPSAQWPSTKTKIMDERAHGTNKRRKQNCVWCGWKGWEESRPKGGSLPKQVWTYEKKQVWQISMFVFNQSYIYFHTIQHSKIAYGDTVLISQGMY